MKLYQHTPKLFTCGAPERWVNVAVGGCTFVALAAPVRDLQQHLGADQYRVRLVSDGKVGAVHLSVADEVYDLLNHGRKVVVHCRAGRNRSCFVAALMLVMRHGLTGPEALEMVRETRPRAIANPHFERYLREL